MKWEMMLKFEKEKFDVFLRIQRFKKFDYPPKMHFFEKSANLYKATTETFSVTEL